MPPVHSPSRSQSSKRFRLVLMLFPAVTTVAEAQESPAGTMLNPVVVTGAPVESDSFDLPYAIDSVDVRRALRGNLGVNASEVLGTLPGLVIQNRQNYAQDLQISIRGFGSRAAFGVRGVKLIADGIPATNPDGQGQVATFNLDTADRIEVLRGPFATIYGNHSGGVIQLFSRRGEGPPVFEGSLRGGSWGTERLRLGAEGHRAGIGYVIDASRFETDGYRQHSATRRDQAFSRLDFSPSPDSRLTLTASGLHQPFTNDPQGLSLATYRRDPRAVEAPALAFDTRKRIDHRQGGLSFEHRFGTDTLHLHAYAGQRRVVQYLSIPVGAQIDPRSAGGVVDFDRDFSGAGVRWTARRDVGGGELTLTGGIDHDRSVDNRKGYENFVGARLGVRGALRRDEVNTITSTDPYAQAVWQRGRWQWSAGVRHSTVRFRVNDDYVVGANGDDSGSVTYRRATPAFGLVFSPSSAVNLYLTAGAGFETPTLNELSYSGTGGGFNFDLKPAKSTQIEAGIKAFLGNATRINAAVFEIRTRDELVVANSTGGRTTFANAARTLRRGAELAIDSELTAALDFRATLTLLQATYDRDFVSPSGTVASGNRLPGVPRVVASAELAWRPMPGLEIGAEALYRGRVWVDDLNTAKPAPAHVLTNLRLVAEQESGPWLFEQMLRIDNVFDRRHVSSVIVGQAQGRYYEPGPTRSWYAGASVRYRY